MHRPLVVIAFAAVVGYSVYKSESGERKAVVDAFNAAAGSDPTAQAWALSNDLQLRATVHQDVFFVSALALAAGGLLLAMAS